MAGLLLLMIICAVLMGEFWWMIPLEVIISFIVFFKSLPYVYRFACWVEKKTSPFIDKFVDWLLKDYDKIIYGKGDRNRKSQSHPYTASGPLPFVQKGRAPSGLKECMDYGVWKDNKSQSQSHPSATLWPSSLNLKGGAPSGLKECMDYGVWTDNKKGENKKSSKKGNKKGNKKGWIGFSVVAVIGTIIVFSCTGNKHDDYSDWERLDSLEQNDSTALPADADLTYPYEDTEDNEPGTASPKSSPVGRTSDSYNDDDDDDDSPYKNDGHPGTKPDDPLFGFDPYDDEDDAYSVERNQQDPYPDEW